MKYIKKIILVSILSLLSLLFVRNVSAAGEVTKLEINFYNFKETSNHTAWVWQSKPKSANGSEVSIDEKTDDNWFKKVITFSTANGLTGSTTVGIIIKEGTGWSGEREPGGDRFIDLSKATITGDMASVYFVKSDEQIYYKKSDADISNKVFKSSFSVEKNVEVTTTKIPSSVKFYETGTTTAIETFTPTSNSFVVPVTQPNLIDISKSYSIDVTFDDGVKTSIVTINKLYDTVEFGNKYNYDGKLGVVYSKEQTTFTLWAPLADTIFVNIYNQGHPEFDNTGKPSIENEPVSKHQLTLLEKGAYSYTLKGDLEGKYYTFSIKNKGYIEKEVVDPYAYSTGANGLRGMIVDFNKTNPADWETKKPDTIKNQTDYILYELHIRDLTTSSTWNGKEEYRGKYLGLAQTGTTYKGKTISGNDVEVKTGLDHLGELGINAVHILPLADFGSIDETKLEENKFDWGYMPNNFNTLEGSYSTNPFDGYSRIKEFKTAIAALHKQNIRVVLDVVYNHTGKSHDSNFNIIVPNYYHRFKDDGSFSNGSGTGNETASERYMFAKFMRDSIKFWATEYNISGFRFDIMSIHDVDTMKLIRQDVDSIDKTIILYGEPWNMDSIQLPEDKRSALQNIHKFDRIAGFNPDTRDVIRKSFLRGSSNPEDINKLKFGISGGNYSNSWAPGMPSNIINYADSHDDETLRDTLFIHGIRDEKELMKAQMIAYGIVLTSQGIPFMQAGADFMRSKPVGSDVKYSSQDNRVSDINGQKLAANSYNLPDSVNQLNWADKAKYYEVFDFFRHIMSIRRTNPDFRYISYDDISKNLNWQSDSKSSLSFKLGNFDILYNTSNSYFNLGIDNSKNYLALSDFNNKNKKISVYGVGEISGLNNYATAPLSLLLLEKTDKKVDKTKDYMLFNKNENVDVLYPKAPKPVDTNPGDPVKIIPKKSKNLGLIIGAGTVSILTLVGITIGIIVILKKKK